MPKPCILISSCKRDVFNGANQAIRDTWGADSAIPYFFLLGKENGITMQRDEIVLDVPDDYLSLPFKSREGKRWALATGFDFFFQCFTDTFIDTERLAASGYEKHDYTGNLAVGWKISFAHGGPGYWTSKKCAKVLIDRAIEGNHFPETDRYEDQWTGRILGGSVQCWDDKRYSMGCSYKFEKGAVLAENDLITEHLSSATNQYHPEWMHQAFAKRYGLPFTVKKPKLRGCNCYKCVALAIGRSILK